jgi:hypothetical protein
MKRALVMSAFAITALSSSGLRAQPTAGPNADDRRAETLFNAAKQLRDGGQVADACPMFAESKRIAPGVGVTLYLADCYERTGRSASAWSQFREAEQVARERGDDKRAAIAHARALALEPKLDRLTVAASAGAHDGWHVLIDGAPLPLERWNAALAVDPGDHVVTVSAPGEAPRTLRAHLDAAKVAATVRIDESVGPALAPPVAPVAGSAAPASGTPEPRAPGPPESPSDGSAGLWIGLALVGVGVTGIGFGTFFVVKRNQLISNGGPCDTASAENQTATAAGIAFAAGGVALASALVLSLTAPSPKRQVGWVVAPAPLWGGAGALVRASF